MPKYLSNNLSLSQDQLEVLRQYTDGCIELSDVSDFMKNTGIKIVGIQPAIGTGGEFNIRLRRGLCACNYQYDPAKAQVGF